MVVPSAAKPAKTKAADARRSEAITGAAINTVIAYGIVMILVVCFSFREFRYKIDWNFIIKSIVASVVMALVIARINPANSLSILATVIIGAVLYCIILIVLQGFKKDEYSFFKRLIWNNSPL